MNQIPQRFTKNRLRSSYISVVVSIALVLFVLGLFGTLMLNAKAIVREVKEDFTITVLLENEASPVAVSQFRKNLALASYVKDLKFISKEEAAADLRESLDEEFVDFLGYNPLSDALEVHLQAHFVEQEKLLALQKEFNQRNIVSEVVYDKPLIEQMNRNIRRVSYLLIGGSILLALVAIALINSSIRLAIYSRRFLIKTMQLVGATKGFIRRPFIIRSLGHGLLGAFLAGLLLAVTFYFVQQQIPGYSRLIHWYQLLLLGAGLILGGVFISLSCTYFALRKYLRLSTDQLYF